MDDAKARSGGGTRGIGGSGDASSVLRDLLFQLPGSDRGEMSRGMEDMERIRAAPGQPGAKRPEDMSPQEMHAVLWQVLTFRDSGKKASPSKTG